MLEKQDWSPDEVRAYAGEFRQAFLAYAADEAWRTRAASGGVVSRFLGYLLEQGEIDGALVLRGAVQDGQLVPTYFIARSVDELRASQGSVYSAVHFTQHAAPLIRAFEGRLAVVGLPCDISALRRLCQREPEQAGKIVCALGLFCGHNSEPALTQATIERLNAGHASPVADFHYRSGHWRGQMTLTREDGSTAATPFSTFSDYRNLYFFTQRKCHACRDHFAYEADLSVGDIWLFSMRDNPIKHNAVIIRSSQAQDWFARAREHAITAEPADIRTILSGQSRTMPFHHDIASRAVMGKWLGIFIKRPDGERARWHHLPVAFLAMLNEKITRSRWGQKLVLALPRPLLKVYLYFFKALESIR